MTVLFVNINSTSRLLTMTLQMGILCLALLGLSTALVCPDGGMCQDKTTCCKNSVGEYGCCPLPHAECCSDHLHCCYEGTFCDLAHERCVNDTVSLPWMSRLPTKQQVPLVSQLSEEVKAVICPDQESECPDETTCCQLPDGSWGCCPLAKAVCCEDRRHCCPEGTTCDLTHAKCLSATQEFFPLLEKLPARRRKNNPASPVGSVTCPGGRSSCPDSYTCCLLTSGDYGCCPYPNAMCCSDHLHCCPSNTICDLDHGVCKSGEMQVPLLKKIPAISNDIECPDKKVVCPDQTTCCPEGNGTYGCCPMPDAVCCSDNIHCCPAGTECDLIHSACVSAQRKTSMSVKFPAAVTELVAAQSDVECPDKKMACPDKTTCCPEANGTYGCCPIPNAVCCSDNIHCCPAGTECDLIHSACVSAQRKTSMSVKFPAAVTELVAAQSDVECPDKKMACPDKTTCCPEANGTYGCCPIPNAVCCSDNIHCCPAGTECDLIHSACVSAQRKTSMSVKFPAAVTELVAAQSDVECPDKKMACPDKTTCCPEANGTYGCCPIPNAVCCSDNIHCCPAGTECDLIHSACVSAQRKTSMSVKFPAAVTELVAAQSDVECPDKKMACPDKTTCCPEANGTYGCCPIPNAVCCSDNIHCCPAGTECDLIHSACVSAQRKTSMSVKFPAAVTELVAAQSDVGAVPCNDSVACADGNTCCKLPGGEWACCPLPKAVCCEDHLHCCPHGTICNLAASTCDDPAGSAVMPWLGHVPVFPLLTDNSKCDKSTSCPGKSTCCKTASGDWACCPLPQAVCCNDHVHCCPHGTVCNLEAETCDDPSGFSLSLPWASKVPAVTSELQDEKCDKQTMCPRGTTCCKKNSGQWACCPLPQAVCCTDHEHCCPKGYKCNVAEQTCDKLGERSLPWLQKIPALQRVPSQAVGGPARPAKNMCDAQTSCPKDTTCCFMNKTHKWGCCPLQKAVCCDDGNHCCPSGHTCEPHRSSCSKGPHVVPWFTKLSAMTEPAALTDVKCDDKSSCASGTTCCKLESGDWGCCPLVKAVCCADHEHCCPQGYTCNMQTGTCEKKEQGVLIHTLPQSKVVPSQPRDVGHDADLPCDGAGTFHCPVQETCCKISATEWACCPSPRAVCCSDSKHCCPAGYSCDLQAGGCTQQTQLTWDAFFGDRKRDFVPRGL